jgi:hypothetical protein
MDKVRVLCGLLLGLGSTALCAKKLYSWEDARGVKHYSDQPPEKPEAALGLQARQLEMDPAVPERASIAIFSITSYTAPAN